MTLLTRDAVTADAAAIAAVVHAAFGPAEGAEISELVTALMADPSAQPLLSLVTTHDDQVVGHVLFTHTRLEPAHTAARSAILAPLAVHPTQQGRGHGGQLIADGLMRLASAGTALVFVLGYPAYYSRHGFVPASPHGLAAPYPIPAEHADAWMVQALRPNILGQVRGQVRCAAALDDPRYWRE